MTPLGSWKPLYDLELKVRAQDVVITKGFTTSLLSVACRLKNSLNLSASEANSCVALQDLRDLRSVTWYRVMYEYSLGP